MDNKILRDLTYGVYVIGSLDGDRKVGCIANSVMQITSNPASIAISINHDNYTTTPAISSRFLNNPMLLWGCCVV